jgi:predicted amidophosphoribosyltransferase
VSNVKSVFICAKCKSVGNVIMHNGRFVTLECTKCSYEWETLSGICGGCKKPNGYATKGLCRSCYQNKPQFISN